MEQNEIIRRIKGGDQVAFANVYESHAVQVYNTIHRLVNHTGEAEDIMQECFITVYNSIGKFEQRSSLSTWINRIAINQSIDALRRRKAKFVEPDDRLAESDDDSVDEAEHEMKVEDVKKAIMDLPDGYRTITSLYLLDGIPQAEIAMMLDISHSTVRTQYKKAKDQIRKSLAMQYDINPNPK